MARITSILDNDLYKFTQQQAVVSLYPNVKVEYKFSNRDLNMKFNQKAFDGIQEDLANMKDLSISTEEINRLVKVCPFFTASYIEYLKNYRFDPNELKLELNNGNLDITISGHWHKTILWEVPCLSIISENYFKYVDTNWDYTNQKNKVKTMGSKLSHAGCIYADFGTRRRRNFQSQERVVETFKDYKGFVGTSNVYLAIKNNVKPIGTMAHEFIMAHQVLGGIRHCNRYALKAWNRIYNGDLGIALPDTLGLNLFLNDFDGVLARLFDGVRHDSGCPFEFGEKIINHYDKLQINPTSKTIVFSDGLDVDSAIEINKYFNNKINICFGIGTNFTNNFDNSPAMKIVIKLWSVNGVPVVKLPDSIGKCMGDRDMLRIARHITSGTPLDQDF
jgi:nicotinate phosphoribosyltransferase